jgi:error-prone DNA polymerase
MTEFAELACQTAFSFHEGASMPEELVPRAKELGLSALGVADRDGVYGMVRAWKKAKDTELPLLHGAMLSIVDPRVGHLTGGADAKGPDRGGTLELIVYAQDHAGWSSMCELLSLSRHGQPKGSGLLHLEQVLEHPQGLVGVLDARWPTEQAAQVADVLSACVVQTQRLHQPQDKMWERRAVALSTAIQRPMVATNRVLLHAASRRPLQDVLTCIRNRMPLHQAGRRLLPNDQRRLRSPDEMAQRFADQPQWLANTIPLAEMCAFRLDQLHYEYPQEVVPDGWTAIGWLRHLVSKGLVWRFPDGPADRIKAQANYELQLIEEMNFPAYFLTVYDAVRFARERGILCQGRGSAANSVVCFALGITAVDPSRQRVLFERFLSKERGEPPDIDVDFEHERREEVLQYLYDKYGRHRAAMVNEIISYRSRSSIRDVGKVLGLSLDQVTRLAKTLDWRDKELLAERVKEAGLDPGDVRVTQLFELVEQIQGFPRHLSIHTGGFVISEQSLRARCPIEPAAMDKRTVIQWDKDDIDAVGFVKVDCLSLGMLTAIRKCFELVEHHHGHALTLATLPSEDPFVYDMICRADTMGVFQIESRAQMSMLPRLRPRCFYDLVIEVSIVRPGPIQGGMVHPYLARRSGAEPVTYAHPDLEPILARTLGVPIFQEQVMEMAMVVGGFSAGEADELRRAMGAWRKRGGLAELVELLRSNMVERGLEPGYAEQVSKQIIGFGEYGFPESHAASFALLIYVSSYLKAYFPAAFCASLLNSQPMGFYSARSLLSGARDHGVPIRPVRVEHSNWDNTLETLEGVDPLGGGCQGAVAGGVALRVGLRQISGLGEPAARSIERAREAGPFITIADFARRTKLGKRSLLALAQAQAFEGLGISRRQACWEVEGLWSSDTPLFAGVQLGDGETALPVAQPYEEVQQDFLAMGFSLERHPLGLARSWLDKKRVTRIVDLADFDAGDLVRIAGIVVNRQRPSTAKGVTFMTLEDETGMANLVVWPKLFEKQRALVRGQALIMVQGRLQRESDAASILAERFEALPLGAIKSKSRDFR